MRDGSDDWRGDVAATATATETAKAAAVVDEFLKHKKHF
jgi:hypothetical protein